MENTRRHRTLRRISILVVMLLLILVSRHAFAAGEQAAMDKLAERMTAVYDISYYCVGKMEGQPERYIKTIENYWNQVSPNLVANSQAHADLVLKENPRLKAVINRGLCEDRVADVLLDYVQAHHDYMNAIAGQAVHPLPPSFTWEAAAK